MGLNCIAQISQEKQNDANGNDNTANDNPFCQTSLLVVALILRIVTLAIASDDIAHVAVVV